MSNQPTDLQTPEKEKTALERLSENPFFKVSFIILGGLGAITTILTGIEKFILPLFRLPILTYLPDWAGILGAVLVVIAGLTLYFVSIRPKNNRLTVENESLTSEVEILTANADYQQQIHETTIKQKEDAFNKRFENLETDYKTKLQESEKKFDDYKKLSEQEIEIADEQKKRAEKELEDVSWLINYAKEQEQNIAHSVEIDKVIYSRSDLHGYPFFSVVFALNVFNKSVFPITFDEKISGKLIYDHKPLELTPTFDETPPILKPLDTSCIRIEQRLTKEEAESFTRVMDRYESERIERSEQTVGGYPIPARIQFKDLIFTIKSPDKSDNKSGDNFPKINASQKSVLLEFEVTKRNFNFSAKAVRAWRAIQPLITPIETIPFDFQFGDNGKMIKGGRNEKDAWGLLVKFFSVPTDYPDISINVKAFITFTNLENGMKTRVNDGVWYDEESSYKEFQTGDAGELIIGFYDFQLSKRLFRYEHTGKKTGFQAEGFPLTGENFEIDVELLGKNDRKHVFQDHFKFKFEVVNDSFKFEVINNRNETKES